MPGEYHPEAAVRPPDPQTRLPGRQQQSLTGWLDRRPLPRGCFTWGLLVQLLAGGLMIGIGIAGEPLWFDELASLSIAGRSPGGIFDVLGNTDANMGFYYLLLHAWIWAGDSEAWVRMLSALPALAAVPVTAILARRLFGERVGLLAGFMLVGNLFVIANAQNARAYAPAMLMVTLATLYFVDALRDGRLRHLIAYGACSVLAIYLSPLAGLALVAHVLSLLALPRDQVPLRRLTATYACVALAVAPLAGLMLAVGDEQVYFLGRPGLDELLIAGREIFGMYNLPLAIASGGLVSCGLIVLWRWVRLDRTAAVELARWSSALVAGWALLPALILFAFSQVSPLFLARYLLTSAPAFAILAAVALVTIANRSREFAVITTVVLCGLVLAGRADLRTYGDAYRPGWGEADLSVARLIAIGGRPGDGVLFEPAWQRLSVEMNLARELPGARVPADFAVEAGAEESGDLYAREVPPEVLTHRLRRHERIWLLRWNSTFRDGTPSVSQPLLDSAYRRLLKRDLGVMQVTLYRRR